MTLRPLSRLARLAAMMLALVLAGAASAMAQSPNCSAAVPDDNNDDSSAINTCLSNGGTVMLANGRYWINATLNLTQDNTVFTGEVIDGLAPILDARPGLTQTMLVVSDSADNWVISNLTFNGNESNRTAASSCSGYRGWASNIQARGTGFDIHHISSNFALCGSALEVKGSGYEIFNSQFLYNGSPTGLGSEPWADGITLLTCVNSSVYDNELVDNTDVDIVVGGGVNCVIDGNDITHADDLGIAGIHIGYFDEGYGGEHDTNDYTYNTISSAYDKLGFGIIVGSHAWDAGLTIEGGDVNNNSSAGAVLNLVVDGISSGSVQSNTWSNHQGSATACGVSYDYTAAHYSGASIQNGATSYQHHPGACGTP